MEDGNGAATVRERWSGNVISNRDFEEEMNRDTKVLLFVGAAFFIFIVLVAAAFYFHIFNIANVVTGDG
jgi:hypothetical protein